MSPLLSAIRIIIFACFAFAPMSLLFGKQISFEVKQATYTPTGGHFQCNVKLGAEDNATLSVTVPKVDTDSVKASIRTNVAVTIATSDVTGNSTRIDVNVSNSKVDDVELTYVRPFNLLDAISVNHDIRFCDKSPTTLSSFLTIKDMSASNANWSKADFLISSPSNSLSCVVSMTPAQSIIVPIGNLNNYQITLTDLSNSILRIQDNFAYQLTELVNLGTEKLPIGNVQVLQNDRLLYTTKIERDVLAGATAMLLRKSVPGTDVKAATVPQPERWHQAVSLAEGILTVQPYSATLITVTNLRATPISVYMGGTGNAEPVAPGLTLDFASDLKSVGPVITADLYDLDAKLQERVKHLDELRVFDRGVDPRMVHAIYEKLKNLQEIDTETKGVRESITVIEKRLKELSQGTPDPRVVARLVARLNKLKENLDSRAKQRRGLLEDLAKLLFPLPARKPPVPPQPVAPVEPSRASALSDGDTVTAGSTNELLPPKPESPTAASTPPPGEIHGDEDSPELPTDSETSVTNNP